MSSSSSCSEIDSDIEDQTTATTTKSSLTNSSKKIRMTEGFGEGNLKGFASAFNTIMTRTAEVIQADMALVEESATTEPVVEKKEKTIMVAHITEPRLGSECEKEISFESIAKRGVVKLFRAVAMHRRREIEHEKGLGIGVDKSGRRRRLIRRGAGDSTNPKLNSGTGMSSFLENLKSQKSKR